MEPGVMLPAPSGKNAVWASDRELLAGVPACGDLCVASPSGSGWDQKDTWELGRLGLGSATFTRRRHLILRTGSVCRVVSRSIIQIAGC